MSQPTLVFIVNRCFMSNDCHTNFNSSQNLRRHLSQVHEFDFPNRIKRPRLHNSELYMYLSEPSAPSNQTVSIQSICPVCDNHFEEVAALKAHFVTTHQEHLP
ncbi:uncharacterized protein BYT42DRAFT_469808, partial [Radiomyces spectabilis]|uniref:uncharacterized protein n=1 Tax=Radiomyces spectabilis TaxID=64574 RepID=UPI00221F2DF7